MKKGVMVFTVLSLVALVGVYATPASASGRDVWHMTNVRVDNENTADITNTVTSTATTGGNTANAVATGDSDDNFATGGDITTGNASTDTAISNTANNGENYITVGGDCGCDDVNVRTRVRVHNMNMLTLNNSATNTARTGGNTANARTEGATDPDSVQTAVGGKIRTGHASTWTEIGNLVNHTAARFTNH